ncbi:DUF3943 domain-containing protein [Sphingobacterium sp. SYP-B4668]|uniref:DUF3943 domain-containing protein n=1 Tax=Sphingobacterium sp. SYP-B4668 TaxID=2996035 RepID=UPI0022DD2143|nr:DUF3943 domain-containing protein [Sphingobacterium sp. SYP-B4668]
MQIYSYRRVFYSCITAVLVVLLYQQSVVAQEFPLATQLGDSTWRELKLKKALRDSLLLPNYVDTIYESKKNFWRAAAEWTATQAFPASFNYFIRKDPYSHISFQNFLDHQRIKAWKWDDNEFMTNQIAHPYHGQLYFNSFRSNGYSFLSSSIATFAGSYIWETGGETQAPSINDLVNTTTGGIVLGEMTHRIANNILAKPADGFHKHVNEALAFLINPINGLNRLIDGKWGKYDRRNLADSSVVTAEVDMGIRRFDSKVSSLLEKGKNAAYGRLRILYSAGDSEYKKPFEEFFVNLEVGSDDSSFVNAVNAYGVLYGEPLVIKLPGKHYGTITANYDFIYNEAFFYGGQSVNYNVLSTFVLGRKNLLKTSLGAGFVLLSAIPDPHLLYGESRNYNYGSGFSVKFDSELNLFGRFRIAAAYNGGYSYTWEKSGNASTYYLHTFAADFGIRFYEDLSLNVNSGYYRLEGEFKDYPDLDKTYPFARISLGYNIRF